MRNIRFGKDITTRWRIKTNGEHESLLGRDLHLILTDQFGNKSELPFVISDTNLVTFVWFGKDHKRYGHHIITLFENLGVEGQTAVDAVDYVNLVEYTTQENNATYDNLSMETVELEGDIATSGRGLNNYELWILDGHQGSLADYLQWARGDKGDPGEDGKPLTWDDLTDEQKESLRGLPGADGADAKINGVNTVRIIQGKNMQINQSGSTMTFDSIPDPASILRTHLAYDVQDSLKKADDVDKKVDKTALDALSAKIGNLSSLSTSAKNNLVSAINEIVTSTPQIYATNLRSSVNDDIFTDAAPWLTMVLDNINGHGSIIMYNTNPRCQEYLYGNIKVDAFGLYTLTFYTFRASAMEVATATLDLEEQRIEPISHDTFSISSINATLAQKQDKINDLATIRSGAAKGATAYQKPSTGIPESDLSLDVKDKLNEKGGSAPLVPIAYAELVSLRNNGGLAKGVQYRITDYVTTTNGKTQSVSTIGSTPVDGQAKSAMHPFDIIVIADSPSSLNENARAIQHDGDTYFSKCNLLAWELKYCLDNDASRYEWATADGKGVIYWMRDEYMNEMGFDFKNLMFYRDKTLAKYSIISQFLTASDGYYYTFNSASGVDGSVQGNELYSRNKFIPQSFEKVTDNVFVIPSVYANEIKIAKGNTIAYNSSSFAYNKGEVLNGNVMQSAQGNILGTTFNNNIIGYSFLYNSFVGNTTDCNIGSQCNYNIIGRFASNTIGIKMQNNVLANFRNNTIGDSFQNNTSIGQCVYCTIGKNFNGNTIQGVMSYMVLNNTSSNYIIGTEFKRASGSSAAPLDLSDLSALIRPSSSPHSIIVEKDADGRIYATWRKPLGGVTGFYKDSATDTTWKELTATIDIENWED